MGEKIEELIGVLFKDVRNTYQDEKWLSLRVIRTTGNVKLEILNECIDGLKRVEYRSFLCGNMNVSP